MLTLDTQLATPANFAVLGWDVPRLHDPARDGSQVDYPRRVQGGLDGGFWAIFTPQGTRTRATDAARETLRSAARYREMVAAHPDRFEFALRADDAPRIAAAHKRIAFMSIENGYPLEADLSLLETFYKLGVQLAGVVHFMNSELADSATDPKGPEWPRRLTPRRRAQPSARARRFTEPSTLYARCSMLSALVTSLDLGDF